MWEWNPSTNTAFQHLKAWICQTLLRNTLAYHDCSKPVIVQTDSSKYDLGTALIQSGRSIAFASKMLTDVESHYINTERECLSVCFRLEKFYTNLYGRHVIIQNDHKPHQMIQQKPIHAPPHLQCMLLCMQKHNYMIQHKPSKDIVLVECLSHFPSSKSPSQSLYTRTSSIYNFPMTSWLLSEEPSSMTQCITPSTA